MKAYIEIIIKYRKSLTLLFILAMVVSLLGISKIQLSRDFRVFVPNISIYNDRIEEMNEDFPSKDQIIIQVGYDDLTMTKAIYEDLVDINAYIVANHPDIRLASSVDATDMKEFSDVTLEAYEERHALLGDFSPTVFYENRQYFVITLFSDEEITKEALNEIETYMASSGLDYAMSGDTYVQLKVFDYIKFILIRVPPMALVVLLGVFYFKLRTIKGTLLSVIPAGLSALMTMGIIGHIGNEVSIITVLAPVFTLVIGSADGLHFITHVQEEQRSGKGMNEVLSHTLEMVGVPMIITTVTSIVGFMTLMVMDTDETITFAIFASIGVLLAGIMTWFVLPLILGGGLRLGYRGKVFGSKGRFFPKLWGLKSLGVIAVVAVIFILGAPRINQEFNMFMIYRPSTEVYKYTEFINKVNGGSIPSFIYGDMPIDIDEEVMMADILDYEEGLRNLEHVGRVMSGIDMVELFEGNETMVNGNISLVSEFVNPGARKFRIMVMPTSYHNEALLEIETYVNENAKDYEAYNLNLTGTSFVMYELNQTMLKNQISSSILAIIVVFLLVWISIRQIKATLASIVPIVLTLLFMFGTMGLFDISLNIVTCTMFSITIGVGIDYAIHFTSIWQKKRREGLSAVNSTDYAYRYTARPILANAFGLSLGFSALFISPLQFHLSVASLMWIAMISSVVFSLVILPSILRRL